MKSDLRFSSDMVLEDLKLEIIPKLPFELPYYVRFVDDIKTAIPDDGENVILKLFNSYHKRLQFTIEIENDNKLNFLDMTVTRKEDGTLNTIWYQKEIASTKKHSDRNGKVINPQFISPGCLKIKEKSYALCEYLRTYHSST